MDTLTLSDPIAATFAAEHNPDDLSCRFRRERGLTASLEISA